MANNNYGREQITCWTPQIWEAIDKAVQTEVGSLRVVQKVFPRSTDGNCQNVPADIFNPDTMTIEEGHAKPYVEISFEFKLTPGQVASESTQHSGRTLARLAAKVVGFAEDVLFFQGEKGLAKIMESAGSASDQQAPVVRLKVVNGSSLGGGLLGLPGIKAVSVPRKTGEKEHDKTIRYGENTFTAVAAAKCALFHDHQPGPYALFLESTIFADTYDMIANGSVTTADRLIPLVTGGFYDTGALPPHTGLLVSLGGEPTTLYVGQDAITGSNQTDEDGNARFRVYERVQLIARDPRAFRKLEFQK